MVSPLRAACPACKSKLKLRDTKLVGKRIRWAYHGLADAQLMGIIHQCHSRAGGKPGKRNGIRMTLDPRLRGNDGSL